MSSVWLPTVLLTLSAVPKDAAARHSAPEIDHRDVGEASVEDPGFSVSDALAAMDREHPRLRAAEHETSAAEADAIDAGLWQNPSIQGLYTRSSGFTTYDPNRGYGQFWASQNVELTGAPRARRSAGRKRVAAARADRDFLRMELGIEVIAAMLELRGALARSKVVADTASAFAEAERVMLARVEAGSAPRYHGTRMQLAAAQAAADLDVARADVELARARLARAIGPGIARLPGDPVIELDRPLARSALETDAAAPVHDHPAVRASRSRADAARRDVSAARRGVWTGVQLSFGVAFGGGYDLATSRSQLDIFGGIVVPLPVVDRGQGSIPAARARERAADERANAVAAALKNPGPALVRAAVARRSAAKSFVERARPQADVVVAEARDGYRDAKLTVLELVDAYESQRDFSLRSIDLAVSARVAELELWRRSGRLPP